MWKRREEGKGRGKGMMMMKSEKNGKLDEHRIKKKQIGKLGIRIKLTKNL
jgi:hypothetical protein